MSHGSFGDLLRTHRLKHGLTQEGVAERAGLSVHAIQKLERGATHPYRDTTNRLVDALRLSGGDEAEFRELGRPAARRQRNGASRSLDGVQLAYPDLPVPLTSFVGREHEIAEINALLESARLITLSGVGGSGKTRLALEVARHVAGRFADGVVLIELAAVADAALVPQAIASSLGIREAPTQPLLATLGATLKSRQILLVLDNCEHLLEASAQVADALLRTCPRLCILATSREALGLSGEVSWRVPSLRLPPLSPLPGPEQMAEFEAVRLFVERARAAHAPFAMTLRNTTAIAQICHQLDGIPLALELAAVRVRGMSVDELGARLDQPFRLLTGGSRAALPRQQTLRATIDWSYQLLTPEERRLFGRLAVFASSWTLVAAEAVCGGRGNEPDDVVDLVLRLVDKSLVVPQETDQGQRYELLQTLRQYGREQLVAADEAVALHDLHAAYFLAQAEQTESARSGLDAGGWTDRLALDQADFDAALDWLIAQTDTERALRLAGVLWHVWEVRGYLTRGRRCIAALVALPGAEAPTLARARVLNGAGVLALNQSDTLSARRHFGQSLRLYRHLQHDRGVAWVLIRLGWLCTDLSYVKAADRFLHEAFALCERLGERRGTARCLNLLGLVAWERGNVRAACALHQRSLTLSRELHDRWGTAFALHRLSVSLHSLAESGEQADLSSVRPLIEEELALWQELGERRHFGFALCDLATAVTLEGNFEQARQVLADSLAIFAELDDPHGTRWVLGTYVFLLAAQGLPDVALRAAAAAVGSAGVAFQRRVVRLPQHPLQLRIERMRKHVCDMLGADAAVSAWVEGQKLSLAEVIVYVQRVSAPIPAE